MSSAGRKTFETFHKRTAGKPVYPLEELESGEFEIDALLPDFVCVGRAVRVLYDSDKWNEIGDVTGYYHTHGPNDGDYVFSSGNKVKLYAAKPYFPSLRTVVLPVKWPDEIVPLGACSGWLAGQKNSLVEGSCTNSILCCSPFGWVNKKDEKRVFLAVVEVGTGIVEAIIDGPGLRVTEAGIEG